MTSVESCRRRRKKEADKKIMVWRVACEFFLFDIGFSFFFCLPEKIPLPRKEAPSTSFYNRTAPMNERDGSTTFRVKLSAPEFLFPAVDLLPGISSSHNSPNSQSVQFFRVRYPFSISGCVVSSCTLKGVVVVCDFCQVGTDGPHPPLREELMPSFFLFIFLPSSFA